MKQLTLLLVLLATGLAVSAQQRFETAIAPLPNEKWWGGFVALGNRMPFAADFPAHDLAGDNLNNQVVPLMLSSAGRYVWSEKPFCFELRKGRLILSSDHESLRVIEAGKTLREAYVAASKRHFPPSGTIPQEKFFSMPQYNTWIELVYDQNQTDILAYARNVIKHGFPEGVFMIDDNWQRYYGNFDFKAERFADPRAMIDTLHTMGFRVMLWIAPFVSPDSPEFRELEQNGYLLRTKTGETAVVRWWNGYSACYDTTNPDAMAHLKAKLRDNQAKYGTDGFKFDGGDISYMQGQEYAFHDSGASLNTFMQRWAELGREFPYNELRACWKLGGQPVVQRLGDKEYSWEALQSLIPDMTAAGLLGYAYTCPDMIGGGQFGSFIGVERFDEGLIVRSAQVHALMPMMQFSVAPWRILSPENTAHCARAARLHEQFAPYILELAHNAARTGEPIVRPMEYEFPHAGFVECRDQFMLGGRYIVAPMVAPGTQRTIQLPAGRWRDDMGRTFKGPRTITAEVPLGRLPWFEKMK